MLEVRLLGFVVSLMGILGCGAGIDGAGTLPAPATLDDNLVQPVYTFASYTPRAGRVSQWQTAPLREAAHLQVGGGYSRQFPLSNGSGLVLVADNKALVFDAGARQSWEVPEWDRVQGSGQTIVFAEAEQSGVFVLRPLGQGSFQRESFAGIGFSQVVFNRAGTEILLLNDEVSAGSNLLTATAVNEALVVGRDECLASLQPGANLNWQLAELSGNDNELWLSHSGLEDQVVSRDDCSITRVELAEGVAGGVVPDGEEGFLVATITGALLRVRVGGSGITSETLTSHECDWSGYPLVLNDDQAAFLCFNGATVDGRELVSYRSAQLVVTDADGEGDWKVDVSLGGLAGIRYDSSRLYFIADEALGRVTTYNVEQRQVSQQIGLFLGGIL